LDELEACRGLRWVAARRVHGLPRLRTRALAIIIIARSDPAPKFEKRISRASRMAQQELSEVERAELRRQLERLREEHRDLDAAIEALDNAGAADRLQMQRLKKRKLALRDRLSQLEDLLTPDIIA